MDCDNTPIEIKGLVKKGYELIAQNTHIAMTPEFERHRAIARKWRNLIGEARYDIPGALHRYVNWLMPEEWVELVDPFLMNTHTFKIEIPEFADVGVCYRYNGFWSFDKFEIVGYKTPLNSDHYCDLPIFLAIARELKKPKLEKTKVVIEEIAGDLEDNANLIKLKSVLSEIDRLNNPNIDEDEISKVLFGFDY